MEITITGRGFHLDEAVKQYVHKRLTKLENHYKLITKCEVILEETKERKNAEVILHIKGNQIIAKDSSPDIYASVDGVEDKLIKQLRRLNSRVSSKKRRSRIINKILNPITIFRRSEGETVEGLSGKIVKTKDFADKPMAAKEAALELDLMEKNFIVFRNADTGEVNCLYKKGDGNYGLIEPLF